MTLVATTPEARRDAIQRGLENLVPIIAAAYKARDWEHFGFDTWAGYVASFGQLRLPRLERQAAVRELREEGLSQRAIGEALGVTPMTVGRDLPPVTNVTPAPITGLDGKAYPAHVSRGPSDTDWYTPPEIITAARNVLGRIDLDPASSSEANDVILADTFFTEEDDGLTRQWTGRVWMNPPYSQPLIGQFCSKLAKDFYEDRVDAACVLVNNATETSWFQELVEFASAICFPKGRIRFWHPVRGSTTPLQGQAIVYMGDDFDAFHYEFGAFGFTVSL